jgi:Fe-S oxidoreductase
MKLNSKRSLPVYSNQTFEKWVQKKHKDLISKNASVYLLCDEFSNYLDSEIAKKVFLVLKKLNIEFSVLPVMDSARSLISKGFLDEAKITINQNLEELKKLLGNEGVIVGIEPSSILGFKDDYKRLVNSNNKAFLENISKKTMTIEEFISNQIDNNLISQDLFTEEKLEILYHGHCHQKSLSKTDFALKMLNFPKNYLAKEIPSGCCGMAGSFGFEQIDLSFQIGDLVLFPSIRKASDKTIISASGTSCRHQIKDGVSKKAFHPIEIFYNALKFPKK